MRTLSMAVGLCLVVTYLPGCAMTSSEMRVGVRPAKAENCELQLVEATMGERGPGGTFGPGGTYEMIGTVSIEASSGSDPLSEEIRSLVRPRACAMGGDVISLEMSGQYTGSIRKGLMSMVWAKRNSAASAPKPF